MSVGERGSNLRTEIRRVSTPGNRQHNDISTTGKGCAQSVCAYRDSQNGCTEKRRMILQ